MTKEKKTILLVGGGTGGHVSPVKALYDELSKNEVLDLYVVGNGTPIEQEVYKGLKNYYRISAGKFHRRFTLRNLIEVLLFLRGLFQAYSLLRRLQPDLIFSKGGYVSLPVIFWASKLRIPYFIHESDIEMGSANKYAAAHAEKIFVGFPTENYSAVPADKLVYVGQILRPELFCVKKYDFGFNNNKSTIFVTGGSQGSLSVNQAIFDSLETLLPKFNIIHQTGQQGFAEALSAKKNLGDDGANYLIYDFLTDKMLEAIKSADLIIGRAGATTVAEFAALKKPMILIPYRYAAGDHQSKNAKLFEKAGAAKVIFDQDLTAKNLTEIVIDLFTDKHKMLAMGEAAATVLPTNGLAVISDKMVKRLMPKHYHLIGDQGVSMRGVAKYLKSLGYIVTGSDLKSGGHKKENITSDIDLVVRTSAVNPGSEGWVEVEEANRLGIKVVKRSELIGDLTKDKKLIAISGMHGKTTVTSMIGLVMIEAGFDPTILVGDEVRDFDNDVVRVGKSDWFVLEACEYDHSFYDFYPKYLILTNIEAEHLDTYPGGLSEIKEAFQKYIDHVPDDGVIVACADDENVVDVLKKVRTRAKVILYGKSAPKFSHLDFTLAIPGEHNVLNALAVTALASELKIDPSVTEKAVFSFKGAHRRFEMKGFYNGAILIDDYGHHPTEIRTTIAALAEKYPDKRKVVVFWPHQYKRIKPLMKEFGAAFSGADEAIIKPIYFVPGRDEKLDIDSRDLVALINQNSRNGKYLGTDDAIIDYLKKDLNKDSVLLTIGIPPVYKIIDKLLEK